MEEIAAANAALALLEVLAPKIQALVKSGDVSVEEQQQLRDRYAAFRAKGDANFSGEGWES